MKNILYIFLFTALTASTVAQLKIIHPNGGERLQAGSETSVKWEGVPDSAKVSIKFSSDSGKNWQRISKDTNKNNTSWITPNIESDSCIININSLISSDIVWSKTYGGKGSDGGGYMSKTDDDGFVIVGSSNSEDIYNNKGGADIIVYKLNKDLETEWFKSFGGSRDEASTCIIQTKDKGFIIAGHSKSNDGDIDTNRGYDDVLVLKIDSLGGLERSKTYGGNEYDMAQSIIQTNDGSYVIAGLTYNELGYTDLLIIKVNSDGNILWQKTLGGQKDEYANSILETKDDGLLIVSHSESKDENIDGKGKFDAWLLKLNPNGDVVWQRTYGGPNSDILNSIILTTDNNYLLVGRSYSTIGDVDKNQGGPDFWILKIDLFGNIIWSKTYGGSYTDYAVSVINDVNGGYVFVGNTASKDGDIDYNNGILNYCIYSINSEGVINWSNTYGGSDRDFVGSVCKSVDGHYLLSGYVFSADGDVKGSSGNSDMWIIKVKYDSKNFQSDTSDSTFSIVNPTSSIINSDNNINFTVRPNIASNMANVSVELTENGATTLELFDSQGRKLQTVLSGAQESGIKEIPIDVSQYPSGRYYLKLTTPTISKTEILEVQR